VGLAIVGSLPPRRFEVKRIFLALLLIVVSSSNALAATKKVTHNATKMPDHGLSTPDDLKWGPAPPVLQPGAELAVLEGNPSSAGPYVIRLKMPDGYKIMPHWHPTMENVTVISGTFHLGTGGTFDDTKGSEMPAGSFGFVGPHMKHFAWA